MSRPRQTPSDKNRFPAGRIIALAKRAGRLAKENRKKGYH
jgi:hypothetical protein